VRLERLDVLLELELLDVVGDVAPADAQTVRDTPRGEASELGVYEVQIDLAEGRVEAELRDGRYPLCSNLNSNFELGTQKKGSQRFELVPNSNLNSLPA